MRMLELLRVECPEECLRWEAWVVHQVLELLKELAVLVLPLRRWTSWTECVIYQLRKAFMMAFQTSSFFSIGKCKILQPFRKKINVVIYTLHETLNEFIVNRSNCR